MTLEKFNGPWTELWETNSKPMKWDGSKIKAIEKILES